MASLAPRLSRSDERLRQASVGVRKHTLKPFPVARTVGAVGIQQAIGKRVRAFRAARFPGKRFEIFQEAEQSEGASPGTLKLDGGGHSQLKQTPGGASEASIFGSAKHGAQSPTGAPVAVFGAFRLLHWRP